MKRYINTQPTYDQDSYCPYRLNNSYLDRYLNKNIMNNIFAYGMPTEIPTYNMPTEIPQYNIPIYGQTSNKPNTIPSIMYDKVKYSEGNFDAYLNMYDYNAVKDIIHL
jgi:hypothetical protein